MANVEAVSSSVVREYLSRKGLKETLAMLDRELPRTQNCINNRAQLAKELHINTLMKKNKESENNYRTMLEVIIHFMISKSWQQKFDSFSKPSSPSTFRTNGKHNTVPPCKAKQNKTENNMVKHESGKSKEIWKSEYPPKCREGQNLMETDGNRTSSGKDLALSDGTNLTPVKTRTATTEGLSGEKSDVTNIFSQEPSVKMGVLLNNTSTIKNANAKKTMLKCDAPGSVRSTGLRDTRKDGNKRIKPKYFVEELKDNQAANLINYDKSSGNFEKNLLDDFKQSSYVQRGRNVENVETLQTMNRKESGEEEPSWKKAIMKETRKNTFSPNLKTTKNDDLICEDVDEIDELDGLHFNTSFHKSTMSIVQCHPVTLQQAKDLKTIVFGSSSSSFNTEWRNQGFSFCHLEHLKYGIVQHKGGPCGLLASVQAVVLKHLLFPDNLSSDNKNLYFPSEEVQNGLCSALVEILWRAGSYKTAVVCLHSEKDHFLPSGTYKADRLTEKLIIFETKEFEELEMFIKENLKQFSSKDGGCILLLYSVILSRSVKRVKEDMDDENGTLMGAHGYCTQDMVNLLLTGKAISNTFDDVIQLDTGGDKKNILKGIDKQSDIGLLSLFEHYKSCLVGSNLKNPKYPIWVVCSESHFSVIFSTKRNLVNKRRSVKKFDLYYYDGLAGQTEEIRLTIDLCEKNVKEATDDDLIPPLEHCIRTKWKDAVIDWNGTEPLL
ncbi:probable ubiquitin carboxyl-terminal hydrolase MINDY-4 isoform X2 [Dendronephthya gigantea]|uniref:probable ubiquitin carboxyl-terminal hydrolase MINDY-4 isoform X2 n=1 Tax=Dendronephthya gigantea TaxID=151771 RepID=UPI00106A498E|nr:probable ubiquitin carboxyl-terminal hydrolase MINDY-4 isoform X2 [Dendronephthya gigantea]